MSWSPDVMLNLELAHPVPTEVLLLDAFGPEYWDWEIETLRVELQQTFRASPPQANMDCIQALRTIHISNAWTHDWMLFEKLVAALNNQPVSFLQGQKPSLGQLMAAVDAIDAIRPVDFGMDVRLYAAAVIRDDGAYPVPPILSFCSEFVPVTEPNDNANDDEEYRKERRTLMQTQLREVLLWTDRRRRGM